MIRLFAHLERGVTKKPMTTTMPNSKRTKSQTVREKQNIWIFLTKKYEEKKEEETKK